MTARALEDPSYPHVERDEQGVPYLGGTTMKVVELVLAHQAHGWSPEELHFQFPHLSMAQIHAALAFYWDHRDEVEEDIRRRDERVARLKAEMGESSVQRELGALRRG